VDEPSVDETIQMLYGLRDRYEAHHKVRFSDAALEAAARLSYRYVTDRRLPDKAIDLMDEAAAKLRVALYSMPPELKDMKTEISRLQAEEDNASLSRDYERAATLKSNRLRLQEDYDRMRETWQQKNSLDEIVDVNDIAEVVAVWTGIPMTQPSTTASSASMRPSWPSRMRFDGRVPVSRTRAARSARSSSWARPVSARPSWPRPWPSSCSTMRMPWCAST
jgi:ATP-dependent Clp protease ATP-binding subunit ClpA